MNFNAFKELVIAECAAQGIAEYELYYQSGSDTTIGVFGHEINEFSSSEGGGLCSSTRHCKVLPQVSTPLFPDWTS